MKKTVYRLTLGALLLLILPVSVWLSGWQWQPQGESSTIWWFQYPQLQYLITETASAPFAALSAVLLSLWFIWRIKASIRGSFVLLLLFVVVIVGGQGVKSIAKKSLAEARPNVMWLVAEKQLDKTQFYALSKKERAEKISQLMQGEERVSAWQVKQWQGEPDYAFPSGHALFVASWALLAWLLLWPRRHYGDTVFIFLWAIVVEGSRLTLGMHWPQDLVVSVLFAWLLVLLFATVYIRLPPDLIGLKEKNEYGLHKIFQVNTSVKKVD